MGNTSTPGNDAGIYRLWFEEPLASLGRNVESPRDRLGKQGRIAPVDRALGPLHLR